MKKLLIAMTLLALSGLANSATVTLDFEGIPTGTDADGYSDQGVTFTQGINPTRGSSGSFFEFFDSVLDVDSLALFRADFATPTSSVSFDLLAASGEDHILNAFNSDDTLLSQSFIEHGRHTLSLSEIAYITLYAASPDTGIFFSIDNFTFDVPPSAVPIPAAAILFAPALLGFMGLRRRAKKQA